MPERPPLLPPDLPSASVGLRPLRVVALTRNRAHPFALQPDAPARQVLAEELGLLALRKLAFAGRLEPEGRDGWRLEARLGATVVQPCVATGVPVTTRIETPVLRRYLAGLAEPQADEAEIPEDDSVEPLGPTIDPAEVMREALSLALPDYPRAAGAPEPAPEAEAGESAAGRPNPFAVLARLRPDPGPGTGGEGGTGGPG